MTAELTESLEATITHRERRETLAWVKTLARRFPSLSNGLLSLFDQAIVSGTSFATAVIINRSVSPELFGVYYLTLSIVLLGVGVQDHVIGAPYAIYSKRRQGRELAEYFGSAWAHHLLLTAAGVVALVVAAVVMSLAGAGSNAAGMWALVGAAPLLLLREGIRRFAYANLQVASIIGLDAFVAAVQLGGLALLAVYGSPSIFAIYGVMAGACLLACLGWYVLDPPQARIKPKRVRADWSHNWPFAKWTLRSFLVGNSSPIIMPWILTAMMGAAMTGTFGACVTLIGMANMFLISVDRVLTPRAAQAFFHGGDQQLTRLLLRAAAVLVAVMGAFCLGVVLWVRRWRRSSMVRPTPKSAPC